MRFILNISGLSLTSPNHIDKLWLKLNIGRDQRTAKSLDTSISIHAAN